MKFRTQIPIVNSPLNLLPGDTVVTLGSCFAGEMGGRLQKAGFKALVQPYGVVFHPLALAASLLRALNKNEPHEGHFFEQDGYWKTLDHQGLIKADTKQALKLLIDQKDNELLDFLNEARLLTITFGSAFAYHWLPTGAAAANCHKLPQQQFSKQLTDTSELVTKWQAVLSKLLEDFPQVHVLLTVSPVRHWKDGAVANQRSKSRLIESAHLISDHHAQVQYFPAYELMMDELRDYRFYAEDMLHPNTIAVDFIWNYFQESFFSSEVRKILAKIEKLNRTLNHRPSNDQNQLFELKKRQVDKDILAILEEYNRK